MSIILAFQTYLVFLYIPLNAHSLSPLSLHPVYFLLSSLPWKQSRKSCCEEMLRGYLGNHTAVLFWLHLTFNH